MIAPLLAVALPGRATAQDVLPPALTRVTLLRSADLLADVDVLQQAFEQLHPGLLRYNTPSEMLEHFEALRARFSQDRTLADVYLAFSEFAATLRCGHTYANFYNQSKAVSQALFERNDTLLPFYFRWVQQRMVVTRNFSPDATLVPGSEIVSIDGLSTSMILTRLMAVARADGGNDAKRIAYLQVQGDDRIEAFDVFLPLCFPKIGRALTLVVRDPATRVARTTRASAITQAERAAARTVSLNTDATVTSKAAPAPEDAAWTLDTSEPRVAVLRMPTWALFNSRWDWKAFLQRSFETLVSQKVPALVIDLRGNEGGLSVGNVLLAHLVDRDLAPPPMRRLVRYRKVPATLAPVLDTWDPSFKDWGTSVLPFDDRFYVLERDGDVDGGHRIAPVAPHYIGRVFVLVGAGNSSATFEFAQQVKVERLGTLVGQATGGNQRGINGGAFFFVRLPRTSIELDLPLIGQFPDGDKPNAGIEPDIVVDVSIDAIASGRDAEMAAVRRLLLEMA